jgi:hypothetical protein
VATCRSSPPPTAGRCGPPTSGPAASTTPPRCAAPPRRCRCWPSGPTRPTPPWPTWANAGALTTPVKTTDAPLTDDQRTVNLLHAATRAPAERGNALLKTTFKALRRVGLWPWRIGAITAAALVLLHHQHGRTT